MSYNLCMAESFPTELGRAPSKIQKSWKKTVASRLRDYPEKADPPAVKKLVGWKNCWRYRIGDYRLIYQVNKQESNVTLLMLGPRDSIYKRLGQIPDIGPSVQIIANRNMDRYLDPVPSEEQRGNAALSDSMIDETSSKPEGNPEKALPTTLTSELLSSWSIPAKYHSTLSQIRTEDDLLSIDKSNVPEEYVTRVMNGIWPPNIEQIVNQPVRVPGSLDELDDAANGLRDLDSFILEMDNEQKPFVRRFREINPTGPWMVKGGPGSGKSTVALYCIKELAEDDALYNKRLKILFTTFTRSLVSATDHLLRSLSVNKKDVDIDAINVDQLATNLLPDGLRNRMAINASNPIFTSTLSRLSNSTPGFSFKAEDDQFILDEIEWIILGEGVTSLEEYQSKARKGRGRRLGQNQRKHLWEFYLALKAALSNGGRWMFTDRIIAAGNHANPIYDYIFIDEAQDLKPAAIRFCLKLAKDPKKVFLTADPNQTIYGASMPWGLISEDLKFTGRTKVLKKNYRTTHQTWEAIRPIVKDLPEADLETLDDEPVYHGEYPELSTYRGSDDEARILGQWMKTTLLQEKTTSRCGAILCPTNKDCARIAAQLPPSLNAKAFTTKDFNLHHQGVKVITMHAAKGLQFPVVAVTGLEKGKMPWVARGGMDPNENESKLRRLFFVACSRAMRRLLVLSHRDRPSPFTESLDEDLWDLLPDFASTATLNQDASKLRAKPDPSDWAIPF